MIQGVCSKHLIRAADKETSAFLVKSRMKRLLNYFAPSESVFILDANGDIVVTNIDDIQIWYSCSAMVFLSSILAVG